MNSNQLPVSGGLAVFFAVIIGYFVIDPTALEGFRPSGESRNIPQVHGIEDVQARLWQDPFAATAAHLKSHGRSNNKIQLSGKFKFSPLVGQTSKPTEMILESPAIPEDNVLVTRHSLETLLDEIKDEAGEENEGKALGKDTGITVLAVMVSAGPYAKQGETRKRMRYAVLSALGTSNYYPKNSGHIGYVSDLNDSSKIRNKKNLRLEEGKEKLPLLMPYEWYEKTTDKRDEYVLVLWLDEDAFVHKPLSKLDVLFGSLGKHVSDIKLIGPYGSGTLKKMVIEKKKADKTVVWEILQRVDAYSATATASDQEINGRESVANTLNKKVFRHFQRTIVTDEKLAEMLYQEIQKRVPPGYDDYGIAIVSEWDTAYGRALPKMFSEFYKAENRYLFTYMRGIDGVLAKQDRPLKSDESKEGQQKSISVERPEGRSQKDYLRRLADQIYQTNQKRVADSQRGIRAIGVLGSDVYDKLLILRVLRDRFPKVVFFTTDLDAVMLHPDQFRWTRNVIVASAYGLQTGKNIPPFRDGYQTSVFRSTLLALGGNKIELNPVIYEIGRYRAIELGKDNNLNKKILARYLTALVLFLLLFITFWKKRRGRKTRRMVGKLRYLTGFVRGCFSLYVLAIVFLLCLLSLFSSSELKSSLVSGQVIDLGAVGLAVFLLVGFYLYFYLSTWKSQRPWRFFSGRLLERLNRSYYQSGVRHVRLKVVLNSIFRKLVAVYALFFRPFAYAKPVHLIFWLIIAFQYDLLDEQNIEPISFFQGVSIWPTEGLRLLAVWLSLTLLWLGLAQMARKNREIEDEMGLKSFDYYKPYPKLDIRSMWWKYLQEGWIRRRMKRLFFPVMIWFLICVVIFKVQASNIPFRGEAAYWLDMGVVSLAFFSFFVLFGFVVDAAFSCRDFIHKLVKDDTWWPFMERVKGNLSDDARILVGNVKREWKEIRLIAMRTGDISKTVYYPVYVILLLLAAQSDYFDNWDMPYPLVLIATVNVGIVLWAAILLRRSALEARRVSLNKTRHAESEALALPDKDEREQVLDHVRFYKQEIESINEGAFLPISEQPWLRALTLMGGGGGSLLLLQAMAG